MPMPALTRGDDNTQLAWMALWAGGGAIGLGSIVYLLFGNALIQSAYDGHSLEVLNELIARHRASRPYGTPDHYVTLGRLLFSRILLVCVMAELALLAGLMRRSTGRILRAFFGAVGHPLNLAVFRIALFYSVFASVNVEFFVGLSRTPREFLVPPAGLGWLLASLPVGPDLMEGAARLLLLSSVLAMLGVYTRVSAVVVVVLGFYVLGVPQLFGKVNHYHHLLWFAAILAASPCGDALSIDALRRAWKGADSGNVEPPGESRAYALPLRLVWLLIGVMYFFPGFWKWWSAGIDWALSDNLRFIMYTRWTEVGDWTPFFRIDRYPLLYQAGAAGTIAFELSFIFLIFFPRLRLLAVAQALAFHTMTRVLMQIWFDSLVRCYVAFFDWHAICRRVGRAMFGDELVVPYDGTCRLCRRTIACLRVVDVLGRVRYLDAGSRPEVVAHGLGWLDADALMADMHAVRGRRAWKGFEAYRQLVGRLPVLWPVLPLLYVWPVPFIGERVYRRVADSRTCSLVRPVLAPSVPRPAGMRLRAVTGIGAFLFCGNVLFGAAHVVSAWPLACYPTFEGINDSSERELIEMTVLSPAGERAVDTGFRSTRVLGLMDQILAAETEEARVVKVAALARMWEASLAERPAAGSLRLYKVTLSTVPELWSTNPVRRELLLELPLEPSPAHRSARQ